MLPQLCLVVPDRLLQVSESGWLAVTVYIEGEISAVVSVYWRVSLYQH